MRRLVIGFATNMEREPAERFCRSLRSVYGPDACDVVLLVNAPLDYFGDLRAMGVTLAPTPNVYNKVPVRSARAARKALLWLFRRLGDVLDPAGAPEFFRARDALFEAWLHPHIARWFAYKRILEVSSFYDRILFSDVKDVAFQAPFFEHIPGEGLHLFEEFGAYGDSPWNDGNYRRAFGRAFFDRIAGETPICMGTVIADRTAALELIDAMTASLIAKPYIGSDQVRMNSFLHSGALATPVTRHANIAGPIATLNVSALKDRALEDLLRWDDGVVRRRADGAPVPVLHMYDRHDGVRLAVETRLAAIAAAA